MLLVLPNTLGESGNEIDHLKRKEILGLLRRLTNRTLQKEGTKTATVLCPGFEEGQYCDCSGDCTYQPNWCSCAEAQTCCAGQTGDAEPEEGLPSDAILCPGFEDGEYCDCSWDCTEQPQWCSCTEAQACCNGTSERRTLDPAGDASSKLSITCFGQDCGYEDEVSFCFKVDSSIDEEVECSTPEEKCCAGGNVWNFPAGRLEPKCGSLNAVDTMVTCTTANGDTDARNRFEENSSATTALPEFYGSTEPQTTSNDTITENGDYEGPDFSCDNGEMTYSAYVCDGDNDCGDCTDEPEDLCDTPCVPGLWNHDEFACVNDSSVTVPSSWLCDGDNDCGDCSDEAGEGCDTVCEPDHYNFPDFTCDNGNVTYSDYVCDGDNDCGDCTDEPADLCDTPCVPGQWNQEFTCDNGNSVPSSWLCDSDNDCGDCSDEAGANCEEECDPDLTYEYNEDADFTCDNGEMTYSAYVCDGDNDCGDCTDEPEDLCDTPCVPGQWNHDDLQCDNGNGPFPSSYACDGWNDCGDCSDETCDQHSAACEGTQEGENFAGRGGYLRKRANMVKTKLHNLGENRRISILAEKRDNMKPLKTRTHIAAKRELKGEARANEKRKLMRRTSQHKPQKKGYGYGYGYYHGK